MGDVSPAETRDVSGPGPTSCYSSGGRAQSTVLFSLFLDFHSVHLLQHSRCMSLKFCVPRVLHLVVGSATYCVMTLGSKATVAIQRFRAGVAIMVIFVA